MHQTSVSLVLKPRSTGSPHSVNSAGFVYETRNVGVDSQDFLEGIDNSETESNKLKATYGVLKTSDHFLRQPSQNPHLITIERLQ